MAQSTLLIDSDFIQQLRDLDAGKNNLVNSLITLLEESLPEWMTELSESLLAANLEAARKVAHTMKSSTGNLGATTLSQHCSEIERVILEKDPRAKEKAREYLDRIHQILPETLAELAKYKSSGS